MTTRNNNRHCRRQQSCLFEALEHRQMYTAAGQLDTAFNATGMTTLDPGNPAYASSCAVQSDGKVVVAGTLWTSGNVSRSHLMVARFNADGSLDRTFGTGSRFGHSRTGWMSTDLGSYNSAESVAVQSDGKIVVAGTSDRRIAIVRLNTNGTLDNSFDADGKKTVSLNDGASGHAVALQKDGKIVVGGTNSDSDWLGDIDNDAVLIRLNANGSLDSTFDHDGKASYGLGWNEVAKTLAIDYSGTAVTNSNYGKIYIAGDQYAESNQTNFVMRVNANGSIDRTYNQANGFAGQGATLFSFSTARSNLNGMCIQRDGKPVLVGVTGDSHVYGAQQFAITRLGTDGWFDPSFNGGHTVLTGFGGNDVANSVVQSATGSLVVAGTVNGTLALASYSSDGHLNTKFGIGGRMKLEFDSALNYSGYAGLARTSDNKLVIAGGRSFRTARLGDNALPIRPVFGDLGRLTRSVHSSIFSESPIDRLVA